MTRTTRSEKTTNVPDVPDVPDEIPEHFADQRLVTVLVQHHGIVDEGQFHAAGYTSAAIRQLLTERVLIPAETLAPADAALYPVDVASRGRGRAGAGDDDASRTAAYVFPAPTLYIDPLVLLQWRLPSGIFGRRTALVFHALTVDLPKEFDVCLPAELAPESLGGVLPAAAVLHHLGVRPFTLPAELRLYGVTSVYPAQPGDVPVAMYTPAVAVAQTLADPGAMAETQQDCVTTYIQEYGLDSALREAVARYGMEAQLQALLPYAFHPSPW